MVEEQAVKVEKKEQRTENGEGSINDLYDLALCPTNLFKQTNERDTEEDTIG